MSDQHRFGSIEDREVRDYVQDNIGAMTEEVAQTLRALESQPLERRIDILAAGDLYSTSMLVGPLVEAEAMYSLGAEKSPREWGSQLADYRYIIKRAVWGTVCNVKSDDKTKGEPDKVAAAIFDKDGVGTKIAETAIIASFAALGSAWGLLGAALGTEIGKKIRDWIIVYIASQLDELVETKLEGYCAIVPTK